MNKARNFPIQPKIIEEKIENGALIKNVQQSCFLSLNRKRYNVFQKNLKISLSTQKDHLTDAIMKTPNHPSSIVTPLMISQQSNMTEIKTLISQSDAIKIELNALKSFSLKQIYIIKKSLEDAKQ